MKQNLFLITAFVLLASSCGSKKETLPNGEEKLSTDIVENPATASGQTDSSKPPEFSFETSTHHFGEIAESEKVSYTFIFTNTGGTDLVIANATGSCGCTVPEYSKEPIAPGKKGQVKVTFDPSGKSGMQSKTISLVANSVPATKVLTVSAEIIKKETKP